MIASSSVVLSNLAYLIGAVVFAVIGGLAVWWRHRKPTSVHANMASFNRGLRALAPDDDDDRQAPAGPRIEPRAGGRPIAADVRPVGGTDAFDEDEHHRAGVDRG